MTAKPPKDRVAAHRARLRKEGGRQIAVHLGPDATKALDALLPEHGTTTAAVEHSLIQTAKRRRRKKA